MHGDHDDPPHSPPAGHGFEQGPGRDFDWRSCEVDYLGARADDPPPGRLHLRQLPGIAVARLSSGVERSRCKESPVRTIVLLRPPLMKIIDILEWWIDGEPVPVRTCPSE